MGFLQIMTILKKYRQKGIITKEEYERAEVYLSKAIEGRNNRPVRGAKESAKRRINQKNTASNCPRMKARAFFSGPLILEKYEHLRYNINAIQTVLA